MNNIITKSYLKIFFFSTCLLSIIQSYSLSAQSTKIYLWNEGTVPMAQGNAEEDKPSITAYFPSKESATGAAVLICPGGGYVTLALDHEGDSVAKYFNRLGIAAFVLRYRVGTWDHKKYQHPVPMLDASRAMRYIRSKSKEWNLNSEKIGVMGFSAGGHLASTIGTMFDAGNPKAKDVIEKYSSRPSFMVLVYPVISMTTKYTFRFGRGVLLGDNASQQLLDSLSTELQVTSNTPPTFMMHSNDDGVQPENSILFYMALREQKVPAELHIYERGGHGYGLGDPKKDPIISTWPLRLTDWLKNQGLLK
ncbi:MAG: alpha/beta hydrolase [Cytophagales bacterium]|nr:MAG: alpha/beta hydrolase [Cytophagales bacterium]